MLMGNIDFAPTLEKNSAMADGGNFFAPIGKGIYGDAFSRFGSVLNSPFQISLQEKKNKKKSFFVFAVKLTA